MPTAPARSTTRPPDPAAIVKSHPNPVDVIRAYVESNFAQALATDHERTVTVITAEGAEVTDAGSYQRVGERLVAVVAHRKEIEAWFKPIKDFAHRLHRMICERETQLLTPLTTFEAAAKANRLRLEREEAQQRRAEELRLAEEARRAEQARLTQEAEVLAARGEHALAAQVVEQAVHTPAPLVALSSVLPPTKGLSSRVNYQWRPVGGETPEARARAVQLVPREFLTLDERKLTAYAKAHGLSGRIPGIEIYDAGSVTVRS